MTGTNELYRKEIDKKITNITYNDGGVIMDFGIEKIILEDYHEGDCCEHVYADWTQMKYYLEDLKTDVVIKEFIICGVKDIGLLLCFYFDWEKSIKIFIPCYNEQNGYYSDELELKINDSNKQQIINITEYKEDNID
jgi:hypothetical protein